MSTTADPGPARAHDDDARSDQGPGGRPRSGAERPVVLLVDDAAENLYAMEALLRRDDMDIVAARSGREALELLLQCSVALAIVDVQMPEMDGFELAALMRGVERTRHVPIIFVTAGARDHRRVFAGYEAGAVDFLFKPIEPHVLRSKVDAFVVLARQRQQLRRSEERFRTLVQTTSQAVWRLSADGERVLEDSPSWRALTGMDRQAWLDGRGLEMVHPDDRGRVRAAWRETVGARAPWEIEYRVRRPDGHYTWTLARAAPVLDERSELLEWIGANTDIEARKQAESLREMFIGILGHDLRNPLNAIMVSTQLALLRSQDPAIQTPLGRVLVSGDRMGRLIEQLLDLTRARLGGGIAVSPVDADLRAIVTQALEEITAGKERLRFVATGDTRGAWDVDRLLQVVVNLVGNALEHGEPGTPVEVRVDGEAAEALELSVHNHGPVVPERLREVAFEPFRRADPERRRSSHGLGLGLFITRQLVLAHGGSIAFESSERDGTVLRVRLPRRR